MIKLNYLKLTSNKHKTNETATKVPPWEVCRISYYNSRTCSRRRGDHDKCLTKIGNKIWKTGEWTQSLIFTLSKNCNLQLCLVYRTISLISEPNKDMLKVILYRLKPSLRRLLLKNRLDSEPVKALQNRLSASESFVNSTFKVVISGKYKNLNKITKI